jgi:hypothetical protein
MYTINEYLKLHPDASLKDWADYIKSSEEEEFKERKERYKKCEEWYKTLEGRYFIINFNGASFCAVKIDKWPSSTYGNTYDCYNINLQYNGIWFEKRPINRLWFDNPYESEYYSGKGVSGYKEITEEDFDNIAYKAKQFKETIKEIDLK